MNVKTSQPSVDLSQRGSGLLLHVTSLPGRFGIGDLGPASFKWIDLLAKAGQRWWQMLPLGPCGEGNSPYRCFSAFAGNPLLISPEILQKQGMVSSAELRNAMLPAGNVHYEKVSRAKMQLLHHAYSRRKTPDADFERFSDDQSFWLDDFALFMAFQESLNTPSWTDWPKPLLLRKPQALAEARAKLTAEIDFHKFVQFQFHRQLQSIRKHAAEFGVQLIGDLPIFVSPESADVWTHPELFQLDRQLRPRAVAGVPPDLFSATGQCWGNPLYNWDRMRQDRFAWWKTRLTAALGQADVIRIDHFRGFESYWRIPAGAKNAIGGKWVPAPGVELFDALLKDDPNLPLLAEDLGVITPAVEALRDRFSLPGMRVLQFGFSNEPGNPHTPCNFSKHCFAYTGTHDNDTTDNWYRLLPAAAKRRLKRYSPGLDWDSNPASALIRVLLASTSNQTIVPVHDLLGLGREGRMNTPGKARGNWSWRLMDFDRCARPLAQIAGLCKLYERTMD